MDEIKVNKAGMRAAGGAAAMGQAPTSPDAAAQFLAVFQGLLGGNQGVITPQLDLSQIPQLAASAVPAKEKIAAPEVEQEAKSDKAAVDQDATKKQAYSDEDDVDVLSTGHDQLATKDAPVCQVVPTQAPTQAEKVEQTGEVVEQAPVAAQAVQAAAVQTAANNNTAAQATAVAVAAAPVAASQVAAQPVSTEQQVAVTEQTAQVATNSTEAIDPLVQAAAPAQAQSQASTPTESATATGAKTNLKSANVSADEVERYYQSVEGQQSPAAAQLTDAPDAPPAAPQAAAVKLTDVAAQAAQAGTQGLKTGAKIDTAQLQSSLNQLTRVDGASRLDQAAGADMTGKSGQATKAAKAVQSMLDSNHGKLVEKIKQLLQNASGGQTGNSITMKIDPPELGQMTLKVTQRADQIYARITPESKDVETAIRENAQHIVNVFVSNGVKPENVHLSIGEERLAGFYFGSQAGAEDTASGGEFGSRGGSQSVERLVENAPPMMEPKALAAAQVETGWVA